MADPDPAATGEVAPEQRWQDREEGSTPATGPAGWSAEIAYAPPMQGGSPADRVFIAPLPFPGEQRPSITDVESIQGEPDPDLQPRAADAAITPRRNTTTPAEVGASASALPVDPGIEVTLDPALIEVIQQVAACARRGCEQAMSLLTGRPDDRRYSPTAAEACHPAILLAHCSPTMRKQILLAAGVLTPSAD